MAGGGGGVGIAGLNICICVMVQALEENCSNGSVYFNSFQYLLCEKHWASQTHKTHRAPGQATVPQGVFRERAVGGGIEQSIICVSSKLSISSN